LRLDGLVAADPDGPGRVERLGGALFAGEPVLVAVASVMPDAHGFLAWAVDNVLAPAAPVHSFRYESVAPSAAQVTVTTSDPHHLSAGWWALCGGLLGSLTRHLGLPASEATGAPLERRCVYSLRLPPANAPRLPPPRGSRDEELRAVVAGFDDLREHLLEQAKLSGLAPPKVSFEEKVSAAARTWHLSPRETEALACLVRGLSNKETAAELGCAITTAELHVTRVLRKSASSSRVQLTARFWSAGT
jgi:DNA-binding CsgD family transcriptional regulator